MRIALRKEESKLNKEVALASIASQETVELKRADVFLANQNNKYRLWNAFAFLFAVIVGTAMYLNQSDIAIRIIETSGAGLLAYFAGMNRGKAQILEQQNRQKEE